MRYALISDIHSNLNALQAVLKDIAARGGVDRFWCLGDIVGYGPDPRECIELLRRHDHLCIAGNHDWVAIGKADLADFNPDAAIACLWTEQQLRPEDVDYLAALPLTLNEDDFTLVHGSPRQPMWEYLLSTTSARANLEHFQTKVCLIGHSHRQLMFESSGDKGDCLLRELKLEIPLKLGESRVIINPGSIGQPRDGDQRASYAIYDSADNTICFYRVPYDIDATRQKIIEHGLPLRLATRLSYGW
ncbi:metallophosphoesterase family protein [Chloroflexota bacterium]